MLGNPKFKEQQMVSFSIEENGEMKKYDGVVYVVDPNGTSEQTEEPSYDIEVFFGGKVELFKHIRESQVTERA
ncbi:MAG: hypothetical protein MJ116_06580 [Lachnospiraceae bacterium]|nr:hypothetical protein [Lachnospiraceae bacterium]